MEATRDRWAALVRRWRRSGKTAGQLADSAGVNAGTLTYWAWRLKREGKRRDERAAKRRSPSAPVQERNFVELIVDGHGDGGFELELGDGRRLRIPAGFDAGALGRLLAVLGDGQR